MTSNNVIGISGLGLIGGSLASAIKKYVPQITILGFDINQNFAERARELSYIDHVENTFDKLANSVDILYLAAPVSSVLDQIKNLHMYTEKMIVSDMCSVKRPVMRAAGTLAGNISFVGGHPMAGSHRSGIEYAEPDLFQNAMYVLCTPETGEIPKDILTIISAIGARHIILSPDIHDFVVSRISHIPQLLAVSLLNELAYKKDDEEAQYELAAGGFRDMTRIGESNFSIWNDVLINNKDNVIADLTRLITRLHGYKDAIQNDNLKLIEREFHTAGEVRKKL